MRVFVYKPKDGLVSYMVDDLRGVTGTRVRVRDVPIEDFKTRVGVSIEEWRERKKAVRAARRGRSA